MSRALVTSAASMGRSAMRTAAFRASSALERSRSLVPSVALPLHSLLSHALLSRIPKGFGRSPEKANEADGSAGASSADAKAAEEPIVTTAPGGPNGGGPRKNPRGRPEDNGPDPWVAAALAVGLGSSAWWLFFSDRTPGVEISWQEFRNTYLASGMVDRLEVVNRDFVRVHLRTSPNRAFYDGTGGVSAPGDDASTFSLDSVPPEREADVRRALDASRARTALYFRIGSVDGFERQMEDAQLDLQIRPRDFVLVRHVSETSLPIRLLEAAPTLLTMALVILIARGISGGAGVGGMGGMGGSGSGGGRSGGGMGGMFGIGKARPHTYDKDTAVKVTFKDVAGCDEAKTEIMEFVQFLKDPSKFTALGAKIPTGALLVGPPGTGKTLLAKATAGEAGVPFFSMSGSDFVEMFVGVGPSRVRDLFEKARAASPSIIFIDEIDAVARKRGAGKFSGGGNDERENTLNALLVEMDGFATTEGVLVLAGTNRVDVLDKAILRPGRFDRQIMVDRPDIKGRLDLFKLKMAGLKVSGDVVELASRLAALTPGFVGADIANICNEAAIHAARASEKVVSLRNFEAAIDRVIAGMERRQSIMTPDEKRTIAFHEAGHAIAGWFLEHADPLLKVTIIPRSGGALGFAQYLPKEVQLFTREALVDRMCMALGGRAAEELNFGRVTTGASDDLDKVTKLAYAITTVYGMNPRIGQISFPRGEDTQFDKPYSEATARVIDEEVRVLVDECYMRTKTLLSQHADKVKSIAELLLEKETISQLDLVRVVGERPWPIPNALKEYLSAHVHTEPAATPA